jgi:hypothetical protein
MEDFANKNDWDLYGHAIGLVSESAMASKEEIKSEIIYIEKIIGTRYYEGDELLRYIVTFLKSKL